MHPNLKGYLLQHFDRFINRATRTLPLKKSPGGSAFNILEIAWLKAAFDTAEYYEQQAVTASAVPGRLNLLTRAASLANHDGLWLEFGVASGTTIRHLSDLHRGQIYGFDSFEGLPEAWITNADKGAFAGPIPVVPANVTLIKGLFADSLPMFLSTHKEPVCFLHVDCDLYSSTKVIFEQLAPRLVTGTVIVFDEYWNYPSWRQHEYKAFSEFVRTTGRHYRYDSFTPHHSSVCIVML